MKKPYKAPKLASYGDLTQMTKGMATGTHMMDNRFSMTLKT